MTFGQADCIRAKIQEWATKHVQIFLEGISEKVTATITAEEVQ